MSHPVTSVFLKTYGCQMNTYDSEKILSVLKQRYGAQQVNDYAEADCIILNTCSVREKPSEKLFSELGRLKKQKQKTGCLILVCGCVASHMGTAILERAPFVDGVFGPQTIDKLPALLEKRQQTGQSFVDVQFESIQKFDDIPILNNGQISRYVSVMEGCQQYCSYCIVPYTRGHETHRDPKSILVEVSDLLKDGAQEITFLGQNVNNYNAPGLNETVDLARLLQLTHGLEVTRLRFTTSHPKSFSKRLIEAYALLPKLASHVHLPVQSGSNRVLQHMKRHHTIENYSKLINELREARSDIVISTDLIVGFPGETEAEFQETLALVHAIKFDVSYVFIYSPRPGTPAALLKDTVPLDEKKDRLKRLQMALQQSANEQADQWLNTQQWVLVTQSRHQRLSGRTSHHRTVYFDGPEHWVGRMVPVIIDAYHTTTLQGHAA
jgi:tRNA-2-methylthio-N6-dimethylallyladenosine synthase